MEEFIAQIKKRLKFSYENCSMDTCVLVNEDDDYLFNHSQINMIVLKKEDSLIVVDVIAGKGQPFSITPKYYSSPYIKLALSVISDCCQRMQWILETVQSPKP